MTLQDLLPHLADFEITPLLSQETAGNILVEYVSIQELPVDDFIRKNELVITTAIGCLEQAELFCSFMKDLYQSEAAAVILSFQEKSYRVPELVLQYAASIGLPLYRIPWEYRFVDVVERVLSCLKEDGRQGERYYEDLQRALLGLYLKARPLSDAVAFLSESFHCPVAITDEMMEWKAVSPLFPAQPAMLTPVAIQNNDRLYGYLEIAGRQNLVNPELCMRYLSLPLLLWFNDESVVDLTSIRLRNIFVRKLLRTSSAQSASLRQEGLQFDFHLELSYGCILLQILDENRQYFLSEEPGGEESIELIILQTGKQMHIPLMLTVHNGRFILFAEAVCFQSQMLDRFLDRIEEKLVRSYPGYRFFWGIAEQEGAPSQFDQLYRHAEMALEQGVHTMGAQRRVTYKDTQVTRILEPLRNQPEIVAMAQETLSPLIQADIKSDLGLMRTLVAYFNHHCNVSETARHLYLHRQSLLYRLSKIEALTGLSLQNHNEVFLLEVFTRMIATFD